MRQAAAVHASIWMTDAAIFPAACLVCGLAPGALRRSAPLSFAFFRDFCSGGAIDSGEAIAVRIRRAHSMAPLGIGRESLSSFTEFRIMSSISSPVHIATSITAPQTTDPASAQESARPARSSPGPRASPQVSGPLANLPPSPRSRSVSEGTVRRSALPMGQAPIASPAARGSSPTRAAAVHEAESPASQPHANELSTMQRLKDGVRFVADRIGPHLAPGLDAAAALHDLTEGFLTSPGDAKALKAISVTSGVAWATSAIVSELSNRLGDSPGSASVSAANLLGTIAGALSTALPFAAPNQSAGIGYGSSSSWAASAVAAAIATGASAARLGDTFARFMQGGSAAANGIAAGLGEAATKAATENNPSLASALTIASGVMWVVGSAAAEGAVLRDNQVRSRANRAGGAGDSAV